MVVIKKTFGMSKSTIGAGMGFDRKPDFPEEVSPTLLSGGVGG